MKVKLSLKTKLAALDDVVRFDVGVNGHSFSALADDPLVEDLARLMDVVFFVFTGRLFCEMLGGERVLRE